MPLVNMEVPPGAGHEAEVVREQYAANILRGYWERKPEQQHMMHRIRWVGGSVGVEGLTVWVGERVGWCVVEGVGVEGPLVWAGG